MRRSGLEPPPWVKGKAPCQASPVGVPFAADATRIFVIACTVGGATGEFLINWRARNRAHAEQTFRQWLNGDWAMMSHTFRCEPCPQGYAFRPSTISGFVILPD